MGYTYRFVHLQMAVKMSAKCKSQILLQSSHEPCHHPNEYGIVKSFMVRMKNLHKTCMFIYPLTFTTYNKLCHGQFPGCCKPPLSIWSRTEHRHISIGLASLHTQRFVCGILSFGMLLVFVLFPGHMTCSCASRFTRCPILMCTINIIRTTGLAYLLCRNC